MSRLVVAAVGEAAVAALLDGGGSPEGLWLLDWQLVPSILLGAFLLVAYKLLPRQPVSWTHAALGAALAAVGLRLAQAGLGWLGAAGTFSTPYGELAGGRSLPRGRWWSASSSCSARPWSPSWTGSDRRRRGGRSLQPRTGVTRVYVA